MTTYEELAKQRKDDLRTIFAHFVAEHQLDKLREETDEFIGAFEVYYTLDPTDENWEHLIEELADVDIVLDQFKLIMADDAQHDGRLYHTLLEKKKAEKIERTLERIKDGYYD